MTHPNLAKTQGRSRAKKVKAVFEAAELYVHGASYRKIAQVMGIGLSTAYKHVQRAVKYWQEHAGEDVAQRRAVAEQRCMGVILEAHQGWLRSLRDEQTHRDRTEKGGGDNGDKTIAEDTTKPQAGDPRFLAIILKAQERIDKLWGLEAPTRVTGAGGEPLGFLTLLQLFESQARPADVIDVPALVPPAERETPDSAEAPPEPPTEADAASTDVDP